MLYQLVLQFLGDSLTDYDKMIALEDQLIKLLRGYANVDGHDCGQGETNIFIITDNPVSTFQKIWIVLSDAGYPSSLQVAYRSITGDNYTILWPKDFTGPFTIK